MKNLLQRLRTLIQGERGEDEHNARSGVDDDYDQNSKEGGSHR